MLCRTAGFFLQSYSNELKRTLRVLSRVNHHYWALSHKPSGFFLLSSFYLVLFLLGFILGRIDTVEKVFSPQKIEEKIYEKWERAGVFSPFIPNRREEDKVAPPFVIMMPLPNVTGTLHIGHALMLTLQDILTRYHRMKGEPALYLPGKDHAAIAAQNVVERELWKKEKKTRHDLGKDEFLRRMWDWMDKYGNLIEGQIRRIGASCDWSRKRFTMDEEYRKAVETAFARLRRKGLIYQGKRLVNWCSRCGTTLSDLEVEYEERSDPLYFIRYGPFTLATVRPETKFGDTAIAVNPKDSRYKKYIGKELEFETLLGRRRMKVIADEAVDPKFGTGVVKVTPAHDPVDFEIGQRHNLEIRQVIGFDGRLNEKTGPYKGLTVEEARERVARDMERRGLLEKIDSDYIHSVGVCYRCGTVIEPMVSKQWFVSTRKKAKIESKNLKKMLGVKEASLGEMGLLVVKRGHIKIIPKRFEKIYLHWMENIKDWCISRQIWWGHPLPVKGSEDTLDTWFSSALWPFATLGWPKKTRDLRYFYPGTVLETGWDILFFWVARMIMMGLALMGDIPFRTVVLHGMVKDKTGKKMSKTRPEYNVDPLEVIGKYGADALRMALVTGVALGQDLTLSEEKVVGYRNFANKVWNIARFTKMNVKPQAAEYRMRDAEELRPEDKMILKEARQLVGKVTKGLDNYQFSQAGDAIYQFMWHKLADVYIEKIKGRLRGGDPVAQQTLLNVVKTCLTLLHPFMPFLTEAVWQELRTAKLLVTPSCKKGIEHGRKVKAVEGKLLIISPWPREEEEFSST